MSSPTIEEAIRLLTVSNIEEFNRWRMKNLTVRPVIDGIDFVGKNLSGAFLNGISCVGTNFSHCNLMNVKLDNVDRNGAYLKYANLKGTSWQVEEKEIETPHKDSEK